MKNSELLKAARFTKKELAIINDTLDRLAAMELRPMVFIGLAAHIIGFTVFASDGVLDKNTVVDLVAKSIEI